jgi:hypothetical protein
VDLNFQAAENVLLVMCWKWKNDGFDGKIALHLALWQRRTDLQYAILAQQLPSMNQRIAEALNTRDFVNFITKELPDAKINFVSEEH